MTRTPMLFAIIWSALPVAVLSACRHPNGNLQTDAYHAPCAEVLGNPLNTMCCAIERPNPSEGIYANGFAADVCLPNGLCKQAWRRDENSTTNIQYYREECTVEGWKNGSCLSVCLSTSVSSNVLMTPCDDTANSTKWCCGETKDCCAGDIGIETLAQTFLGTIATSTSTISSSALSSSTSSSSASTSPLSETTAPNHSDGSVSLSAGAIAGIVIGAVAGIALIGAAWFLIARRRRVADSSLDKHQTSGPSEMQTHYYAHEAGSPEPKVSELSGTNPTSHDKTSRTYELQ
ncbi:hypothetical protein COCVIDRAFT_15168 [Bipolaris victoriae FI3]|uniref:Uncharacterized protein n=1 Tax=Bipolaris victoriae (strain FI3) TaxID=930091 RepID=W7EIZ2_BIPV3|nr:hypothetical protein COCVIDRAFT_15168 [Bipolaris victoriae FI3]